MNTIDNAREVARPFHNFFEEHSPLIDCLYPLLRALNWQGETLEIVQSLPHLVKHLETSGFRKVMQTLGYKCKHLPVKLSEANESLFPALFIDDKTGEPIVVMSKSAQGWQYFCPKQMQVVQTNEVSGLKGTLYVFKRVDKADELKVNTKRTWFGELAIKHKELIYQLLGVGFFLNLFAIASSLFVMVVYDKVIGNSSLNMLWGLGVGMLLVLTTSLFLSRAKARMIAFIGAKIDLAVGNGILERLLSLPTYFIENTTVGAQVSRVKDFDSVREFFTGPLFGLFFELPFVFLYVFVIACIAGPLAMVPLVMVVVYVITFTFLMPIARRKVDKASEQSSKRQRFLVEVFDHIHNVKSLGAESVWVARYRDLSADSALANYHSGLFNAILSAFADASVIIGVSSMLVWGVALVLDQSMTTGALIASMILIWRILGPIRQVFTALPRLEQTKAGVDQINNLMRLQPEVMNRSKHRPETKVTGNISFENISFRYPSSADYALQGVSLVTKPNQIIAITGNNGSGKSTLFKLFLGLYPGQSGTIMLEGADIRQYDPLSLRQQVAYLPQSTELFYGTLYQNILLANPLASEEDVSRAILLAGLTSDIQSLPMGLDTQLTDKMEASLPSSVLRKIALARAYVKRCSLYLLDEPATGLDNQGDQSFINALLQLKQEATILMITHRPSHMKVADAIAVLQDGELAAFGPASDILAKLHPQSVK